MLALYHGLGEASRTPTGKVLIEARAEFSRRWDEAPSLGGQELVDAVADAAWSAKLEEMDGEVDAINESSDEDFLFAAHSKVLDKVAPCSGADRSRSPLRTIRRSAVCSACGRSLVMAEASNQAARLRWL